MTGVWHINTAKALFVALCCALSLSAQADYNYDYYEGSWSVLPDFSALTPVQSDTGPGFDISPRLRNDQFGFRFTGQITAQVAGNYGFRTNSDDGSRLWIDGQLVIDNDGLHAPRTVDGFIFLAAGTYSIEVTFFEQGGGEVLDVSYSPPGGGFRQIPADGILDGPDSPSEKGVWGPIIPWPHVPVSAANLPDGRVLTWASNEKFAFPGGRPEFTFTGVWAPASNIVTEIDHPSHDMFCAHVVMLENGQPFVSGGRNSADSPWTSVFDFKTDQWVPLNIMNKGRWYPTSLALADGTVFTAVGSGGGNTGESYDSSTGTWTLETGLNFNPLILNYPDTSYGERHWWPLFSLAPDGRIFHSGPTPQMHWIDTDGLGSATPVGPEFTNWYPKHGSTIMYDEGKLLTAGGWINGTNTSSTNQSITIDISGAAPVISPTAPMHNARKFHNGVMLPNGEVLVVGGNTSGLKFNDTGSIYTAEIWDPQTGQWTEGAAASVPRNYHSIALLLTDATVLSAGGGLCNCSADHADGQVYQPPYLFNTDGSLAVRPVITSAPAAIRPGDVFDVQTDTAITQFSLVKMSSTTHGINTDVRYIEVQFSEVAVGSYDLDLDASIFTSPANAQNVLTPGYWMLFALNAQGTPSVAHVLQVRSPNVGDPPAQTTVDFDFSTLGDLSSFVLNGNAAGVGNVLRLTDNVANQTGSAFYEIPITISGSTSFSTRAEWRIHGTPDGADGLAFVVQGNTSDELGAGGGGLGVGGVDNSLAIEIDYYQNAGGDPDDNHIGVTIGGVSTIHMGTATAPFDLEDGQSHAIWVDYDGNIETLEIYLAQTPTDPKPALPILTIPSLDLLAMVGSQAYFGFSGATGGQSNYHDIEAWSLAVGSGGEPLVVDPVVAPPQPIDGAVYFAASATGTGLEYSWSFGDGSSQTSFDSSSSITHTYAAPGRYFVTLIVRDVNGAEQSVQFVQSVHPTLATGSPRSSSSILFDANGGSPRVWNTNPDNDTVTVIDASTHVKLAEIPVGDSPHTLAIAPGGNVWVTNRHSDDISIIDSTTLGVVNTRSLPANSQPYGLVMDKAGGFAYVTLEASGLVLKLDASVDSVLGSVDVGWYPRHLSLDANGTKLFVSRYISPPYPAESTTSPQTEILGDPVGGEVVVIDAATMLQTNTVVLEHSNRQAAENTGPGFPNYLGPAIISPTGLTAWVPSKQDNILRGSSRSGDPLDHDHTVRAVSSVIDLGTELEDLAGRVDQDNASVASNGAFGKYGIYLFVALEGNRQVSVVDVFGRDEILRFGTDFAPQGVAVSDDGLTVYVHNFMGRSVTVADVSELVNGVAEDVNVVTTVNTVATESLTPQILLGKQLFYDALDPRLAAESYMACASCHNDGGHDGRVWDISSMGEGLRNTIDLRGHAGMGQGLLHWSANFDEVQDFENQIRALAGGTGLMSDPDFTATEPTLGAPKTGLSADLDALAAYAASLTDFRTSPYRNADGSLTPAGMSGQALFANKGCITCHSGAGFTDSPSGVRHDIGTIKPGSGQRMGGVLDALDTPTLKGIWANEPYLHDGSAQTIREAIEAHSTASLGGVVLTGTELDDLEAYVAQIDTLEAAANELPTANAGNDQNVTDLDADGSEDVALDGSASNDSDGTIASYEWSEGGAPLASGVNPTVSLAVGTHSVDLLITDDRGATATDQVVVTVESANASPVADAGPDQTVSDTDASGSEDVTLDGSGSNDPDGTLVSYEWSEGGTPLATGANPTVSLAVGTHTIDLLVTDDEAATGTDQVVVTVEPANTAPIVDAGADLNVEVGTQLQITGASATDDGLPTTPGTVSVLWTEQGSSAASWPLGDQASVTTTVLFSAVGTYTLRLTADDGDLTAFDELTVTVTGDVVTPVMSPAGGVFDAPVPVTLTTATGGATIYYTLDGSDPDETSAAYGGAPILVSVDSTLKARAYKTGVNPSGIASAIFLFQSVPTNGLVGYWGLDEGSGTVAADASSSNNDGSLGSNAAWEGAGYLGGNALTVNGSSGSHVRVPDAASLQFGAADDYTVSFWVKLDVLPGSWQAMLWKGNNADRYAFFVTPDNKLQFVSGSNNIVKTAANITTGSWQHVAAIQEAGHPNRKIRLYINGVEVAFSSTAEAAGGTGDLFIGSRRADNYEAFVGDLDEVRIYNRALSDQEVLTLTGQSAAPVADAGPDQTLADLDDSGSEPVTLDGSASADPDGTIVNYRWTEGATVLAEGAIATAAVNLAVGTHTIDLAVTDNDNQTTTDTVIVTIDPQPANTAPLVNAGPDLTVTVGDQLLINSASVTDDGLPTTPGTVSVLWTEQGSAAASWPLADQTSVATTVLFSTVGTYTLRLTADDGDLAAFDELTVTVTGDVVTPVMSPAGGVFDAPVPVTLTSSTGGATIYYTLDGSDPDQTSAAYGGAPILISVDSTLKARAYKTGVNPSGIASAIFLFQSVPTAGLVGQWSLDEGSGTVAADDSSSNNDGSLGSNAAWEGAGYLGGNALTVDGSSGSHVRVPDAASLQFGAADDYTVSFWVKLDVLPGSWQALLWKGDSAGRYAFFVTPDNKVQLVSGSSVIKSSTDLAAGSWQHVVGIQEAGHPARKRRLYIDGVEVASSPIAQPADGLGDLFIGARRADSYEAFVGDLDEVRIYNRALSDQEVLTLTSQSAAPVADAGPDQTLADIDDSGSEPIILDGSASADPDGSIVNYRWTEGATVLAEGPTATAAVNLPVGVHTIDLAVTDNDNQTDTDTVIVTVDPQPANAPPVVAAGTDLTITVGDQFLINGASVTDDGLPTTPGTVSVLWTEQGSAAASWPLADQTSVATTVLFSTVGTYTLRLTADDGDLAAFDELTVTVTGDVVTPVMSPAGGVFDAPVPVTLTSSTGGATIYYTLDGSDPDQTSAAYGGAPVLVSVDTTLKARAYKTGVNPSGIASAIFLFQSVPTAGLVGQWSLDEGSGTVAADTSSSNNDGSLGSNAAWQGTGYLGGNALTVDGTSGSHVRVPDDPSLQFGAADDYTVSFWVKLDTLPGSWQALLWKGNSAGRYAFFVTPDNKLQFVSGATVIKSTTDLAAGSWQHVMVVQETGHPTRQRRLYLNGLEVASSPITQPADGPGDLFIGSRRADSYEAFVGDLDEVRIYNRALSDQEVLTLTGETE